MAGPSCLCERKLCSGQVFINNCGAGGGVEPQLSGANKLKN
jgi:hypothetical protein